MTRCQLGLPVLVGAGISPAEDALELLVGPGIEVDRLDSADVSAHAAMDARATDADEDAEVPTSPSRVCKVSTSLQTDIERLTLVSLAIGADLIRLQLEEALDGSLVLRRPLSGGVRGSPRHCGRFVCARVKVSPSKAVEEMGRSLRVLRGVESGNLESDRWMMAAWR